MITACSSGEFTLGDKFIERNIRTVIIDTCSIKMSTVTIDSVVTSGRSCILIGGCSEKTLGRTMCTAYLAFTVPGTQSFDQENIVFDSLELVMKLNGVWIGDTARYQTYNVYALSSVIALPDDEDFYSTQSVPYGSMPLAVMNIRPEPLSGEEISVRLPDRLGEDLLDKIIDEDDEVLGSQERFMNYFNGLAITAGNDNNTILGVTLSDTGMVMRLYYHYSSWEPMTGTINITALQERCFYGVTTDRSDTPFACLEENECPSSETGNMVLVQALTASYVKIEFPYLNNLLELGDFSTVLKGLLIIYPVKGTYSSAIPLPDELSLYVSNENDVTLSAITTYSGDALQTGDLVTDDLFGIETCYTYDITTFLADQLGAIGINRRSLQLIVPQDKLAVTLETLVAGDAAHSRNRTRLKISYLIYDDK